MKFTPEEMAYDAPADVSDPKRFPTIAKGRKEWEQLLSFKRGYVRLDPDVRAHFKDDKVINELLRKLLEAMPTSNGKGRKRSA